MFEASERGRTAHYKLTSTVMLHLTTQSRVSKDAAAASFSEGLSEEGSEDGHKPGTGSITLSGSMTRQVSP